MRRLNKEKMLAERKSQGAINVKEKGEKRKRQEEMDCDTATDGETAENGDENEGGDKKDERDEDRDNGQNDGQDKNKDNQGDSRNNGQNGGDNNDQNRRKKINAPERLTYAEVAKDNIMLEIRGADGRKLLQRDYDSIAIQFAFKLCEVQRTPDDWEVTQSGMSMGAIWYGVKNETTQNVIKGMVPLLQPAVEIPRVPPTTGYKYFGPGERPYLYPRLRVPALWACLTTHEMERLLKRANESIDRSLQDLDGTWRPMIFRVVGKANDVYRDKRNQEGRLVGLFSVNLEVEAELLTELVELKGILKLGPHQCFIDGKVGELIARLVEEKEKEVEEAKKKENNEEKEGTSTGNEMES